MPENTLREFLRLAAATSVAATNGRVLYGPTRVHHVAPRVEAETPD